jgi:ABC-type transport system involved in multi-copper enzyme maturation permease subunit
MVHLGGVLLAGLPILSLAQLWGGVDMVTLVLNFANTFFNLLTVGCFSLMISVLMRRTLNAVLTVYGVMLFPLLMFGSLGLSMGASPFGFLQFHTASAGVFVALIFLHLLVSTLSLVLAHVFLRRPSELPPRHLEPPPQPRRVRQRTVERTIRVERDFKVPPVSDEPLFWKEYYFGPRPHSYTLFWGLSAGFLFTPLGVGGLALLAYAGARHHADGVSELHNFGWMCRLWAILCALLFILWSAFRAAGSLVRERQNKTLDELLTIPMERSTILGYKWLGNILHGWIFALFFGAVVVLGTMTTGLHLAGGIFLLGAVLIHACFWTTLGLYLSVVCKTVLSAYTRLGLTLLFVVIGTALYAGIVDFGRDDFSGYFLSCGLNPLACWWLLAFTTREYATFEVQKTAVGGCLAGVLVYALLTLSLWLLAYGRFQRERYRHVE